MGQENGHLIGVDFAVKLGFDRSGKDQLLSLTTGIFLDVLFIAHHKPFVVDFNGPKTVI
jgi:hypothetical protein